MPKKVEYQSSLGPEQMNRDRVYRRKKILYYLTSVASMVEQLYMIEFGFHGTES